MSSDKFLNPNTVIIIFAREPVVGQVKTRLIPALGKQGATELYRQFLDYAIDQHTVSYGRFNSLNLAPVQLCITPESRDGYFYETYGYGRFTCSRQVGNDLGSRMYNALDSALKSYSKAILIGTDCPFLSPDDLQQAVIALDDHDVVFSPASDGGYVLIGVKKRVTTALFNNIDWGTERVMAQTRGFMKANKLSWLELTEKNDIDIQDDLRYLLEHNEFKGFFSEN